MSVGPDIAKLPHAGETAPLPPEAFNGDVIAWFEHLREAAPVSRDEKGTYLIARYDDVYEALNDPETFSSHQQLEQAEFDKVNVRSIVYADDPEHLDFRKLVNRAWTPGAVIEFRDAIARNVDELVGDLKDGEPFDVVRLGLQVSQRSFSEAMGLPNDQHERIARWFQASGAFVRPDQIMRNMGRARPALEQRAALYESGFPDMAAYFYEIVEKYGDCDLATLKESGVPPFPRALVAAHQADPANIDLILTKVMPPLLAGGVSTLSHVFPNAVDVLLEHPDLWARLRADETLLALEGRSDVIEEILRLRAVVQGMPRVTTRDVEVSGTVIPKGSLVQLCYLSAGRDEAAFEQPDAFRDRGLSRHLTFGFGTHTCMGQSLVRLELKIFLRALLKRFARLERVPAKADWGGVGVYYTPDTLPVVGFAA